SSFVPEALATMVTVLSLQARRSCRHLIYLIGDVINVSTWKDTLPARARRSRAGPDESLGRSRAAVTPPTATIAPTSRARWPGPVTRPAAAPPSAAARSARRGSPAPGAPSGRGSAG